MKAKHFARLRLKAKYYEVSTTISLFGVFTDAPGKTVLAYSHSNACERYNKRHNDKRTIGDEKAERWAYFRVKLKDKVAHKRHFRYF